MEDTAYTMETPNGIVPIEKVQSEKTGIFFAILGRGPRAFQIGKISVVNQ